MDVIELDPSVKREVTVRRCIGCGGISTADVCTGSCSDHRLDLVGSDEHQAALAAVAELETQRAIRRAALREVAGADLTPEAWQHLRTPAKAALYEPRRPEEGTVVTTWECRTCGRIEAPQECIGVCVRPAIDMVTVEAHREVIERARRLEGELDRLAPPLRMLAWSTPRPERHDEAASAVRAAARAALARVEGVA